MKLEGQGTLLRIYLGEMDRYEHKPLYEAIVVKAREQGLAGATVLRGVQGFGAVSRVMHTAKILRLSEDLPILVEIVDTKTKVEEFLKVVETMFEVVQCGGMITLENVEVIKYTSGK